MTTAALHDAIGAKLLAISGVKVAFADGSTQIENVLPWTQVVTTMPAVVVTPGDTDRAANTGRERYARLWDADFYISALEPGAAMQWINQPHDSVLASARTNYTLDRTVSYLKYIGSRGPTWRTEGQGDAQIAYLLWKTRWSTQERVGVQYTATS